MSTLRDLITHLQEKYDSKDTFFASPEDYAFFGEQIPPPPPIAAPKKPQAAEPVAKLLKPQKIDDFGVGSSRHEETYPARVGDEGRLVSGVDAAACPKKAALTGSVEIKTPEPVVKPTPKASYLDGLRSIVAKAAPQLSLKETIPDDSMAKKVGSLWQEHLQDVHVAILSFGAQGKELAFLQNVAAAVSSLLAPAQVIDGFKMEGEQKWDLFFEKTPLKLVLAPPLLSWKGKMLARHFRENPTTQAVTLGPAAAILLRPLREYLQNPSLKRDLWKTLVSHLSP